MKASSSTKKSPPNKKLDVVQNKLLAVSNPAAVTQATERTQDAHA
ncbi:hypothetical protein OESDEN_20774 [Oesophagostomum dentatum]|uniref:Uncharacterized protein n=1 Tax=Oesophagostomum dentatum TaxID=61180 RepID=A0A0B1S8N1_OESDE|nr:hypothetical protein OESDEN_20774 [Oesophagostomum dentatum]